MLSLRPGARVLLDQEDRPPLLVHQPDHLKDGPAGRRIEPDRRLVEHDQRRIEHQAAGQLDQALLAAGQAPGLVARALAHEREQLLDLLAPAPHHRCVPDRVRAHLDVLAHGHLSEQAVGLRDQHDALGQHLARRQPDQRVAAGTRSRRGAVAGCR